MSQFNENQKWRYATKKFDSNKKISNENLELLKEAIQLSSSSYGLQPYKIYIVENPELRAQILPNAWGQSQVVEASHLLVFANQITISDNDIDSYLQNIANTRNIDITNLTGYGDLMKGGIGAKSEIEKENWTSKQAYLALANLLNAAAELKIDVTPMEGFIPEAVNKILGLDALGLNATLLAPIGYRHQEDKTQHYPKVRKPKEELFSTL